MVFARTMATMSIHALGPAIFTGVALRFLDRLRGPMVVFAALLFALLATESHLKSSYAEWNLTTVNGTSVHVIGFVGFSPFTKLNRTGRKTTILSV